jgi:hypothetical protein
MMRKIITSAALAAALTTSAFAANILAVGNDTDGEKGQKYNTEYLAHIPASIDVNETNVSYTGSGFNANYKISLAVTGGAKFNRAAGDITLFLDNNASNAAINTRFNDENTSVEFTISGEPIGSGTRLTFAHDEANGTLPIQLPKGTSGDVKLELTAVDHNGADMGTDASASYALYEAVENKVTGKLVCGKVAIDTTERKTFDVDNTDRDNNTTSYSCILDTTKPTAANIDFSYTDMNATITYTEGEFELGQFIAATAVPKAMISSDKKSVTLYDTGVINGSDHNFTYNLNSAENVLAPTTFTGSITYQYSAGTNGDVTGYSLEGLESSELQKWTLDVYVATVYGMVHREGITKSIITVYNESTSDTTIELMAKSFGDDTADTAIELTDNTIAAGKRKTLITGRDIPAELNGYNLEITMDVEADKGNTIGYQNTSFGKVDLKVQDGQDDK